MKTNVILLMAWLVLNAAAWRWDFNSRDTWTSVECDQRPSSLLDFPFTEHKHEGRNGDRRETDEKGKQDRHF